MNYPKRYLLLLFSSIFLFIIPACDKDGDHGFVGPPMEVEEEEEVIVNPAPDSRDKVIGNYIGIVNYYHLDSTSTDIILIDTSYQDTFMVSKQEEEDIVVVADHFHMSFEFRADATGGIYKVDSDGQDYSLTNYYFYYTSVKLRPTTSRLEAVEDRYFYTDSTKRITYLTFTGYQQ